MGAQSWASFDDDCWVSGQGKVGEGGLFHSFLRYCCDLAAGRHHDFEIGQLGRSWFSTISCYELSSVCALAHAVKKIAQPTL